MASPPALPCGPFFPESFLVNGERNLLQMPVALFWVECLDILHMQEPEDENKDSGYSWPAADGFLQTAKVDQDEYAEAVRGRADSAQLIQRYRELREAMTASFIPHHPYHYGRKPEPGVPFDAASHQPVIDASPPEFREYILGAIAYHREDFEQAAAHFERVLALNPVERRYRSVWAAFMLGKSLLNFDLERAAAAFERTRELVAEGFPDSLGLAGESISWQAQTDYHQGRFLEAIHRYVEYWRKGSRPDSAFISLRWTCTRALRQAGESELDRLVDDELSQQLVTAWLVSNPREETAAARWLEAARRFPGSRPIRRADRLAWLAYESGDMGKAAAWLEYCDAGEPYARWVRAKLLLREGKLEQGEVLLQTLAKDFPMGPNWRVDSLDDWVPNGQACELVQGDLGATLVRAGRFEDALTAFLAADDWDDAALIAERILTPEELESYLGEARTKGTTHIETVSAGEERPSPIRRLQYLMARRWARLGNWDKAIAAFPGKVEELVRSRRKRENAAPLVAKAREFSNHLEAGRTRFNLRRVRAEHLFEAGRILREYGMELTGTELSPDWALYGGGYYLPIVADPGETGTSPYGADFDARFRASAAVPYERFHYRYRAADLMWECAELLPDNDSLTAHALYLGGVYLKNDDPKQADRFYKALVLRNPNLLVGRLADQLRWFPREFNDMVLYRHPTQYPSKREMAVWFGVVVLGAGLALFLVSRYHAKRRRSSLKDGSVGWN
jgi:tetratricopeptide (TPR) repeat protein